MKATVIMGIYNCEKTLPASVDSLLKQTFQCFDIVLCEDGSTDNTYAVAKEYAEQFPGKITLLQNERNQGLAYSLNHCFQYAKGEYIVRMDADDVSRSDRLEKQISFLERNPNIDFVGANAALFDEHGVWGVRTTKPFPTKKDFLSSSPFIHPTVVIRRTLLEKEGGYHSEKKTLRAEDYELFMRFYAHGAVGANIQELLIFYREDSANFSRRAYRYRLDEAKVRQKGFKDLALLPFGYVYVAKPLIVGLFPQRLLRWMRRESIF